MSQNNIAYEYNRGRTLLEYLGTFWSNFYVGQGEPGVNEVSQYLMGLGYLHNQAQISINEMYDGLSKETIHPFRERFWYWLTFRKSDMTRRYIEYGSGLYYGEQPVGATYPAHWIAHYGDVDPYDDQYIFPLPPSLVEIPLLLNRILGATVTLVYGIDYNIVPGKDVGLDCDYAIVFDNNPFDNDAISKIHIYDDQGRVDDEEIGLWVYRGKWDYEDIYQRFGYALGIYAKSSEFYRDFISILYDCRLVGTSLSSLYLLLAAITGIDVAKEDIETVTSIQHLPNQLMIATDKHVYTYTSDATAIVDVGDTITCGQPLSDSLRIFEFTDSDKEDVYGLLPGLALGSNFLNGDYRGELVFPNRTVDLELVGQDEDGKTIVQFEVSGFSSDVEKFWETVHKLGKTSKTLAECLDTRDNPTTQPTEAFLPSTVNPMQFLIDNIVGNNLYVIYIRLEDVNNEALGIKYIQYLRPILPPESTFIIHMDLPDGDDEYDLDSLSESTDLFIGVPLSDIVTCNESDIQIANGWFVVREFTEDVDFGYPPVSAGIDVHFFSAGQLIFVIDYVESSSSSFDYMDEEVCCTVTTLYYDDLWGTWYEGEVIEVRFGELTELVNLYHATLFSVRFDYIAPGIRVEVDLHAWDEIETTTVTDDIELFTVGEYCE